MPNEYTIPLGGLNQILGVSGVEDVTFEVPTVQDIIDAVVRNTLDRTDVDEAVASFVVKNGTDIFEFIGQRIDETDEQIADVVEALEAVTGVDVPGDGSVLDGVADVTLGREDVLDVVDEAVRDVFQDFTPDEVDVNVEGIFGPLSEDVARGLEDIIGFDPNEFLETILDGIQEFLNDAIGEGGDLFGSVPTIEDVDRILTDGLDGLSPDIDGVEFWRDPLAFLESLWEQKKTAVVSEESRQNLIDALEEATDEDGELI